MTARAADIDDTSGSLYRNKFNVPALALPQNLVRGSPLLTESRNIPEVGSAWQKTIRLDATAPHAGGGDSTGSDESGEELSATGWYDSSV